MWIQGKDYGYEFPVPDSVKARERERMQPISVAATYSTVQQTDSSNTATTTSTTTAATTQGTTTAADSAATTAQATTPAATTQSTTAAAATTPPRRLRPRPPPRPLRARRLSVGYDHAVAGHYQQHDDGAESDDSSAEQRAEQPTSQPTTMAPATTRSTDDTARPIGPCRTRLPDG